VIRLLTWNVLHRVHAVNWREPVIERHTDEHARIAAIVALLAAHSVDVACLQEVSGDQLASLRATFQNVHTAEHRRVPKLRGGTPALRDPREYLVTIGAGAVVRAETFAHDRGKGFLATRHGELLVVNTHVSYGGARPEQCARLAEVATPPAVIAGDFNADAWIIERELGFPVAPNAKITRPRLKPSDKSQTIDHVAPRGVAVTRLDVLDCGGLSDHDPVVVELQ